MMPSLPLCYALLSLLVSSVDSCLRVVPPEPGMPAIPCKTCADNLIAVTQNGSNPMEPAVTVRRIGCARRTFVCKGNNASIQVFSASGRMYSVNDQGTGAAALNATCNGAGTAWQHGGEKVVRVECVTTPVVPTAVDLPCQQCAANLISKTTMGANSKDMDDDDETLTLEGCTLRRFTCKGTMASIAVFGPRGEIDNIADGDDGNVDGTATFTVACNGSGDAWETGGMEITRVECTAIQRCKTCDANLLVPTMIGSGMVAGGEVVMADPCNTRQFTCTGIDASIAVTTAAGEMLNIPAGDDGTAILELTCNDDGSRWMNAGRMDIIAAVCSGTPRCETCAANRLVPTNSGGGNMTGGEIMMIIGECHTRQFTCTGIDASIAVTTAAGEMLNIPAGDDGTAILELTCNDDGSRWMNAGRMDIIAAVCSGTPRCETCAANRLVPTNSGGGNMTGGEIMMIIGECHTRQFTCTGIDASIAVTTAAGEMLNIPAGDDGTAILELTCNDDGSRWMNAGRMDIIAAVCSGTPRCETCAANRLVPTNSGGGNMTGGEIMMIIGECHTRQFTCTGIAASIAVTTAAGEMLNIPAGDDGTAILELTCNDDGSRWMNAGRMDIIAAVCSGTPRCETCAANRLVPTNSGGGNMTGGEIMMIIGECHTRQFTCTGIAASIAVTTAAGEMLNIPAGDDGTAILELTCNDDGSRWMNAGRMDIIAAVCSGTPRCETCAANRLVPTNSGGGNMTGGEIMMIIGECHTRQFTCTGIDASIAVTTAAGEMLNIPAGDDGTAILELTCNDDGSRWMNAGRMDIIAAVCSGTPRCETCAANRLVPTNSGGGNMTGGEIMMIIGECHTRQFTCTGIDASIAVTTAAGEMLNIPAGDDGTAILELTCNDDGSRWMNAGRIDIIAAVCSGRPPCQTCMANQLTVTESIAGKMTRDMIVKADPCHTREFTCSGLMASISIDSGAGLMPAVRDNGSDMASLTATCNNDARWTYGGRDVTEVDCRASRCKSCEANQLTTYSTPILASISGDVDTTGACYKWTLTCRSGIPSVQFLNGANIVAIRDAGFFEVSVTATLVCNEMGNAWLLGDQVVTRVECTNNQVWVG